MLKALDKILISPKTMPTIVIALCIGMVWYMFSSISNSWNETVVAAKNEREARLEAAEKKHIEIKKNCKLSETEKQFNLKGHESTIEKYSCNDGVTYSFFIGDMKE